MKIGNKELTDISYHIDVNNSFNNWNDYIEFAKGYLKERFFVAVYIYYKEECDENCYGCYLDYENQSFGYGLIKETISRKEACDIDVIVNEIYNYVAYNDLCEKYEDIDSNTRDNIKEWVYSKKDLDPFLLESKKIDCNRECILYARDPDWWGRDQLAEVYLPSPYWTTLIHNICERYGNQRIEYHNMDGFEDDGSFTEPWICYKPSF